MSYDSINNRFAAAVHVINASCEQRSVADTASLVYGSDVELHPGEAQDGLTFRWTVGGTKTGTNAAHVLTLMSSLSSTPLLTLTADDSTAVDWRAEILMRCYGGAAQKIIGKMGSDTADPDVDYAAGTASLKDGAKLWLNIDGHASDTTTTELCILEAWVK